VIGAGDARHHQISKSGGIHDEFVGGAVGRGHQGNPGRGQARQAVEKPEVVNVNDIGLQPVHQFSDAAPENGQEIEQLLFGAVAVGQHGVWHDHGHAGDGGLDGPRPGLFPGSGEQAGGDPIVGHTLQVGGIQRRVAGRQDMQIDAPADRLCRDLLQIDPGAGLPGQLPVDKENPSSSARATPLADRLDPLRNLGPPFFPALFECGPPAQPVDEGRGILSEIDADGRQI
jgi:hypothetical protein